MREALYNAAWAVGIQARNLLKRHGLLGPIEPVALRLAPLLVRPPSTDVDIALPNGMRMIVPGRYPVARSFTAGLYEVGLTRFVMEAVQEGMAVVDVGANVGYYTLLASHLVGSSGRVYAFEPDPTAYAYLVKNVEANDCRNVVTVAKAVSDATGIRGFVPDPRGAEGALAHGTSTDGSIPVETVTLDCFLAQQGWPAIHLVKMDVEGGEQTALVGMRELRRRNPDIKLMMEFNSAAMERAGVSPESLASVLVDLGFNQGYVIEQGMKPFSVMHAFPRSRATYNLLLGPDVRV